MAIYAPGGKRDRFGRPRGGGKRDMVVILSLTAMVDMFTVLTVFLLQNYNVDAIQLKKTVPLPPATTIEKLKPAHVVTITQDQIFLNDNPMANTIEVKEAEWWEIVLLKEELIKEIAKKKQEMESGLGNLIKGNASNKDPSQMTPEEKEEEEAKRFAYSRVTLQSDKDIDMLTIKKVMYTITQAGAALINFAVNEVAKERIEEKYEEL